MKYLLLFFTSIVFAQLPSSGTLSISMINTELGRSSSTSNSSLQALANLARTNSTPYVNRANPKISHWYGYDHTPTPFYPYTIQYDSGEGDFTTCKNHSTTVVLYSADSFVVIGTIFYTNTELTAPANGQGFKYYDTGSDRLLVINSSGVVTDIISCDQVVNAIGLSSVGVSIASQICGDQNQSVVRYYTGDLDVFTTLYTSSDLTTTYNGGDLFRYSSTGNNAYKINASGVVTEIVACP